MKADFMVDIGDSSSDYSAPPKPRPVGVIAAVVTFIILMGLGLWVVREKKADSARQEKLAAMDKELTDQEALMKAQKDKLIELSAQLESMKVAMQMGKKGTVAEYNKIAAQQRTERQTYTKMAEEYNKRVVEYKKLEE